VRVTDAFVTPVFWRAEETPGYVRDTLETTFHISVDALPRPTPDELVDQMQAAGVSTAVLNALEGYVGEVAEFVERYPDRFLLSVEVDPRGGMRAVRTVEWAVRDRGAVLVRMVPFVVGLPPSDRVYYPVLAKCVELGVPVGLNTGIPAPRMPAEPQRPLHLDEVARFFPELTIIIQHGADPWCEEAIRLLAKYPNLYLMTSAWAPRRLPEVLVDFMNGRGRGKVIFASDHPALSLDRCAREARGLALEPDALASYLSGAADRLWGQACAR
jgi:predicted TIM-barrel fold metal-dependent hydrolase